MGRQLLSQKYPHAGAEFGQRSLEHRPAASMLIAQIIGIWSEVEFYFALLFGAFLGSEHERTRLIYVALRDARMRNKILKTAASISLTDRDMDIFNEFMVAEKPLVDHRNDLAHGIFGISDQLPTAVLWVSQDERVKNYDSWFDSRLLPGASAPRLNIYVYDEKDLERIKSRMDTYKMLLHDFVGYAMRGAEQREAQYAPLRGAICHFNGTKGN